jgi:replication-associated recombination protein RarA
MSKKYGIPLMGLYGVGGIGKTTLCQILCNEFSTKMQGRVDHVELGSASNLELLQGALKTLTTKSHDVLNGLNLSQV